MSLGNRLKANLVIWFVKGITNNTIRRRTFILLAKQELNKYLKEDQMETAPWYKSKAKIAAILGAIAGAITPISTALGHPIVVPTWIFEVLGALGIYGVRDAIKGEPK
jgi:hypothetical protein